MAKKPKKTDSPETQSAQETTSGALGSSDSGSNSNDSDGDSVGATNTVAPVVGSAPVIDEVALLKRYIDFLHVNHPNKLVTFERWLGKTAG